MKKLIAFALLLTIIISSTFSISAELIPASLTRNIKTKSYKDVNPVIPGESSTTGLPLNKKDYLPMLVQIDNNRAALPQWGISQADVMYEMPIQGKDLTRFTALFSDQYPKEAGPVRSGRVHHADLREEWDSMFFFYGRQEADGSNLTEALSKYGAFKKGVVIDGIGGKYEKLFPRVRYHVAPHNVSAQIQDLYDYVKPNNYPFKERPFLFSDELPTLGVPANQILISHAGNVDSASSFLYDNTKNTYTRATAQGPYIDLLASDNPIEYSNIIVQRTKLTFNGGAVKPLLKQVVGKGAAEIFIGGKYIAGAWERKSLNSRTVFFDSEGNELRLQRGKTWIIVCDVTTDISYYVDPIDTNSFFKIKAGTNKTNNTSANTNTSTNTTSNASNNSETVESQALSPNAVYQDSNAYVVENAPKLGVPFKFSAPKKASIPKYYTAVRVEGIGIPLYCFVDTSGEYQYRIYGQIEKGKLGFYPINFADEGGGNFSISLTGKSPVSDKNVFAKYKAVNIENADIPNGFTKAPGDGIYSFTNIFGKKEYLAFASLNGSDAQWYFANIKIPMYGSPAVSLEHVYDRMSTTGDGEYKLPKSLSSGYAIEVLLTTSNGEFITALTDKPVIDKGSLTTK